VSSSVLDASALLALLRGEPGSEQVRNAIAQGAAISAVNLSEVVAKLSDSGVPDAEIHQAIDPLRLETIPFDEELAYRAGLLRPLTRQLGLSLGDRACLALAERLGWPALTADQNWQRLQLGITVQLIR
jgi:ribonuclease VapC